MGVIIIIQLRLTHFVSQWLSNVGIMLGQRCRRWPNNTPIWDKHCTSPVIAVWSEFFDLFQSTCEIKETGVILDQCCAEPKLTSLSVDKSRCIQISAISSTLCSQGGTLLQSPTKNLINYHLETHTEK